MDIVWQAHNAVISERLRQRAAGALDKVARRLGRAVDATVRFEREGTRCRVELVLHAPRHKSLIAEGHARYYGPALAVALDHLTRQVSDENRRGRDRNPLARRS
jgi:ribosome-associated translation inhibitor RaiA